LELKTSARNYKIVKIHCSLDQGEKKGPVGCKYWVVRKVLKWRWLALLPVRLLLFAGGPSVRQRRCAAAVVAGWWTRRQASGRLLEMGGLPSGRYEHMNQKDGAWIEDGVETGWLDRSVRATTAAVGCWLLAVCCISIAVANQFCQIC
jgi:hypothetical protein